MLFLSLTTLLFILTVYETFLYLHVCLKAGLQSAEQELFYSMFFFTTVCGKPQHMANQIDWITSDIKRMSGKPLCTTAQRRLSGARKLRLMEVSWGKTTTSGQGPRQGLAVAQQIFLALLLKVHF